MMEKHVVGENGISYTLGADGLYYPGLKLPEEHIMRLADMDGCGGSI